MSVLADQRIIRIDLPVAGLVKLRLQLLGKLRIKPLQGLAQDFPADPPAGHGLWMFGHEIYNLFNLGLFGHITSPGIVLTVSGIFMSHGLLAHRIVSSQGLEAGGSAGSAAGGLGWAKVW